MSETTQTSPDFRRLFESLPGRALVVDPAFVVVALSDEYGVATRLDRATLIGRNIFDALPPAPDATSAAAIANLQRSFARVRDTLRPDTVAVQRYDIPTASGGTEERWWSSRNSPVLDDDGVLEFIVQQTEDVTEFVRLQASRELASAQTAELRDRAEHMEAEVVRRAAELQAANDELREANAAKNRFLGRMSHELRTPLTAITGFSELLTYGELPEEEREWAGIILRASGHLAQLIDEVLDLSSIEQGRLTLSLEPVPLRALFEDVLELLAPVADHYGVTLAPLPSTSGPEYVRADHQRLKQVLINLVSNAIKYNRTGGTVRLRAEPVAGDEQRVRVAVEDTGAGLDAAQVERLFVPFERLDAAATGIEGTGLGLSLSLSLVQAMGGRIVVESTPGTGSTFTVELLSAADDVVRDAEDAAAQVPPLTYDGERRLLYIEDTVANVRLIEAILRRRPSVRVMPAMLGSLGIELAREHRPDLILLDVHLPDLGGAEVLALLRDDPRTRDIPVVVLSADATRAQRAPMLEGGAAAYVTKPIGVTELLALVDAHLGDASAAAA
jgi:signal transduction histidine kinase/CheY-like chemotaxis protein